MPLKNELSADILINFSSWEKHPGLKELIKIAIKQTVSNVDIKGYNEISILLTSDTQIEQLNRQYRSINQPTNVLSFPSEKPHLGDIILSYEYIQKELINLNKKFEEHISHLIIHGTLHLYGFDHENDKNAVTMENMERHIMSELGYNDPYEIIQ
ncbi:MAG: rRNA maturation RNase YbeY [Hyphomicrobiales bacterium]